MEVPIGQSKHYKQLTPEDVDHFMTHGYVVVRKAFTEEKAKLWTSQLWTRLGYDPNDKSTWAVERVNMATHNAQSCREFAPAAWAAICDLCGGEDRLSENGVLFGDGFICNFGKDEYVGQDLDPRTFDNWHVDGDFFTHYLDSPEQSLLLIPLFSQILPGGGGTVIFPDGIPIIAKHLYDHPEGVNPRMVPNGEKAQHKDLEWFIERVQQHPRSSFLEMTGEVGDVVIMHPLMMHSASKNTLRTARVITNPPCNMKEPFRLDRANRDDYSLIELKTLAALGLDKTDYKVIGQRKILDPTRVKIHQRMKEEEKARMAGLSIGANKEKGYDINVLEGEVS